MDAFDRYGRHLVEAGRRRRLGKPIRGSRSTRRTLALVVLFVAIIAAALGSTALLNGRDVAAEAAELVARVRQFEAAAPPCRTVRATTAAVVLHGVEPLPSTRAAIEALRRPQTSPERKALGHFAEQPLKNLPPSELLGDSLRILPAHRGVSAVTVVTRELAGHPSVQRNPVACLLRQRAALPRLAGKLARPVSVRAESILDGQLARARALARGHGEGIFTIFRGRDRIVSESSIDIGDFARAGQITEESVRTPRGVCALIVGLVPDSVRTVELKRVTGRTRITARVVDNTFAILVPKAMGRMLVLVWRGRHRQVLRRALLSV